MTHHTVSEKDYAGGDATREPAGSGDALKRTHDSVRRVLRRFDVRRTVAFFGSIGVTLKREETGKLFPTTDDAHTVLDALLHEARTRGVEILHPWRVGTVTRQADSGDFVISRSAALAGAAAGGADTGGTDPGSEFARVHTLRARRVILATGGLALPKTGSDGGGYALAKALGHTVTPRVFPALVPLVVDARSFIRELSGLTVPARVEVRLGSGKKVAAFENSLLCTHFGLSGPAALDASRYCLDAAAGDPQAELRINWVPGLGAATPGTSPVEVLDALLVSRRGISPARLLGEPPCSLPDRLARALCAHAGVDASATTEHLPRDRRRGLAAAVTQMVVPVTGERGFTFAEATAGGVPLDELELSTMESKRCPRLHLCGELCDVDGRIGGFNFQWAWSSGWVAGEAAVGDLR